MNKSEIGHRTLVKVMTVLVNLDKALYVPFGDHGRVDLICEEEDGVDRKRVSRFSHD